MQCLCVPGEAPPLPGPCVAGGGFSQGITTKKGAGHGSALNYSVLINYLSLSLPVFFQGRGEEMGYDQEP